MGARAARADSPILPIRDYILDREPAPASVVSLQTGTFDIGGGHVPFALLDVHLQTGT